MRITILGAGNAGTTVAADLTRKGHTVTLVKTSSSIHNENFEKIKNTKNISVCDPYLENYSVEIHCVTQNLDEAVRSADVIIFYIQTNYHEDLIKKISHSFRDGQVVILEPGYLSTCYFLKHCDKDITCIEAESSPIDCRITAPGDCQVLFKNVINPFGVYPKRNKDIAANVLNALGYPYRFTDNVVEAALHNPNLIVHTIGALFSIPRIEYTNGEYWMYKEVFTPHVWNVCESLDNEKMNVMSAVGVAKRQSYVEACQERNFINDSRRPLDAFYDYANNSSPKGPNVPDSRYLTEDVSEGLVLLESLGKILEIPTPTCTSIIDLAGAALNKNFRLNGRTIDRLGKENIKKILNDN